MREALRMRWGVDCVLGALSQHRLFLSNLALRAEESQKLVESNEVPPSSTARVEPLKTWWRMGNRIFPDTVATVRCDFFLITVNGGNYTRKNSTILKFQNNGWQKLHQTT